MSNLRIKQYLFDELDKILALVGILFSLALTIWLKLVISHPIFVMVGILCFIVCTGYLIIKRFFYPSLIPSLEGLRGGIRFYITLNILFFLLFSYSIITIYLRPDLYIRPLMYFIATALMAVIVANEILFLSPQKSQIRFALFKIIIIGLSLQYSQILIFPSIVGQDPWNHQLLTLNILDNGYIPEGFGYSKLPIMHLIVGITSLVTDLGYKMATMFSISTLQVICDALFVYLLGKFLISTKVGLLAALLLEVSNHHIFFGCATTPNTMAAILILPIISILLKLRRDNPFIGNSVIMLLMGTLILTHTVTAMCLAILLYSFWLSFIIYTRLFNKEINHSVTWMMCVLFSTGMLAYWSYISEKILTLAKFIKLGFYLHLPAVGYQSWLFIPLWEQVFSYLGMFLFFSISFIGCFYMISKQFRNSNRITYTISGLGILSLAFFPLMIGMDIMTNRWFYFSQILLAIPLSLSLLLLNGIFKNKLMKSFLMSISVFVLSFLLIMSPEANIDNRLFSPNSGVRYAFIKSELHAMDTILEIWNGTVGIDFYGQHFFYFQTDVEVISIDNLLDTGDFSQMQDMLIIVRKEMLNYPIRRNIAKIKYNPFLALDEQKFSLIYDCGSASGYLRP